MSILNLSGPRDRQPRNKRGMKIWMGIGLVIAVLGVGSTLASTITINQGNNAEFGQGVQRTIYCGGTHTIKLVPISGFINTAESDQGDSSSLPTTAPGSFYLAGIKVTDIPKACSGKDFVFSAYDKSGSSTPVAISTLHGVSITTPTVYWLQTIDTYGGILSLDRNSYVPPAGLGSLSNIQQDGDFGGFTIHFLDTGSSHAAIDSIARIVVETQDDTFGADEHTNGHHDLSLSDE